MKNVFFALFTIILMAGCTADSLDEYENNNQQQFTEVPDSNGIYMEEIDKDKIRRPGSQGDD